MSKNWNVNRKGSGDGVRGTALGDLSQQDRDVEGSIHSLGASGVATASEIPKEPVKQPVQTLRVEIVPMPGELRPSGSGLQTVVVGQPAAPAAPAKSDEVLLAELDAMKFSLGFTTALSVSNREVLRTHLLKDDLGFFEDMPDSIKERRERLPLPGDAAFDIAKAVLGDFEHGKLDLQDAHDALAAIVANNGVPLDRLMGKVAGVSEDEDESGDEDEE